MKRKYKDDLINTDNPKKYNLNSSVKFPNRLKELFFDKDVFSLAKSLLGKILVRIDNDNNRLSGKIIETESYDGTNDPASHSYKGETKRNKAMFMGGGTIYVYYIYGKNNCMNIVSQEKGGAVLIRSLEPIDGIDRMILNRKIGHNKSYKELCNGPVKLCQAMNITKEEFDQAHICKSDSLWIEDCKDDFDIVNTTRIGVNNYGDVAKNSCYRFYVKDNIYVSKINKNAEKMCVNK